MLHILRSYGAMQSLFQATGKNPLLMRNPCSSVYLLGAGGHAKVIIDLIEREGQSRIRGVWDANPALWGTTILDYPILGDAPPASERDTPLIIAIGDNHTRCAVSERLRAQGFQFATAIHPAAVIARTVMIGAGTVIMAGVVVNMGTVVGEHVILNTSSSVDHDCRIGNGVHIAPGAHVCGGVRIGDRTLIGAGSVVIQNIQIGSDVIVGAGATVVRDVPDSITVMGTPARIVRSRETP